MSNNLDEFLSKLSNEQKEFVQFNTNNTLVSASAGSGKTFSMISKLVALLVYYDVDVDDLLVVTFTNAAGEELKQKLYFGLLNEINSTQNTHINKEKLFEKLEKINTCDIGTLHSVCYKYIMKYFYKCGISPTSSILSDEDTNFLLNEAINNIIDESDDNEFYELFNAYSNRRNNQKVVNIIKNIYYFLESLPDVDKFKNDVVNNKSNRDINTHICSNYILSTLKNNLDEYIPMFSKLLVEADSLGLVNFAESISSIISAIKGYKQCSTYEDACKYVHSFTYVSARSPSKPDGIILDFVERYKEVKELLGDEVDELKKYYIGINIDEIRDIEAKTAININKCLELVDRVKSEYDRLKKLKDGLDYGDLEHGMLQILSDDAVLKELKSKYKYIFVDEYQDINNLQEKILTTLSNGYNLYMIGDVKQSIYGFRLCTPDIFIEKYNRYKTTKKSGTAIEFNKNFRSIDNILQFVNYVFSEIATKDSIGIDYKNSSMLVCGKEIDKNEIDSVDVELNIIKKPAKKEKTEDDEEVIDDNEELEAKLTVEKVKQYLNSKYLHTDSKELRNVEPKDIAILIRDKSMLLYKIYTELLSNNIPVTTELKLDLFGTYEVNLLISYLKLLSNPNDDLSMVTVLRSIMVGLSDNDLANIRSNYQDDTYVKAIENYMENFDDDISYKIKKLYNDLMLYREKLSLYTLKEIMVDIVTKYSLNNYFYSFVDGVQKIKNINMLMGLLSNTNYEYNLSRFLKYVELLSAKEYTTTVQGGINAVTIITMHKSKGLDYPVVIATGLGKKFSNQSLTSDVIVNNDLGVGLKYNDTVSRVTHQTIVYMANKLSKESSERSEQIRLLYVALTRARNYLCMIGTYDIEKIHLIKNKDILKCNSFLELIIYSMLKHNNYKCFEIGVDNVNINNKLSFNAQIYNTSDIYTEDIDNNPKININYLYIDDDLVTDIKSALLHIYPYEKQHKIALKTSVSSILNDADYVEQNYEPKELVVGETVSNKTSLEIGNAYHYIMERVDYLGDNNIEDIIRQLKVEGKISTSILSFIKIDSIRNAISAIKGLITSDTMIHREKQFILRESHSKLVPNSTDDTFVMVQGVIDLMLESSDGTILVDFKTNRVSNDNELIDKYKLQIDLYSKAIELATNRKVSSKYLYSFALNKLIKL